MKPQITHNYPTRVGRTLVLLFVLGFGILFQDTLLVVLGGMILGILVRAD